MSLSETQPLLLHNPKCSKSRAAKLWLEQNDVSYTERLYLESPLSVDELQELRACLGEPVRDWVRSGEGAYTEAGLTMNASDEDHIAAIAAHPILLERPIFVHEGQAAIGRPLQKIIDLL